MFAYLLILGSVKPNIGHSEAAAGVSAVIKISLMMHHGVIPPMANFTVPNPDIPFEEYHMVIPRTALKWQPNEDGKYLAGTSGLGFGGANGHLIYGSAPKQTTKQLPEEIMNNARILFLSAPTEKGLEDHAKAWQLFLKDLSDDRHLYDVLATAYLRSQHYNHRLTVVSDGKAEMIEKIESYITGKVLSGISSGVKDTSSVPSLCFVFTGI